eukprot:GEMP01015703.1.p1 GENE.GEMP01015703.1~~GEMP01015703.1.p1  ORF type:complete len:521 (+),score=122.94 GEMP01015703.1:77-1639(+)
MTHSMYQTSYNESSEPFNNRNQQSFGGMDHHAPMQTGEFHGNWRDEQCRAPRFNEVQKKDDDEVRVVQGPNGSRNVEIWRTFDEVRRHFPDGLVDILTDGQVASFTKPTNVQAYTWPSLLAGHDMIGIAKTGSGKTLAFLLPGFIHVKRSRHDGRNGPKIVVLAPTRELCQQIYEESEKFGEPADIISAVAYGGADRGSQLRKFRQGPHVAIACPGRFLDFLERGQVRIGGSDIFVLDEADRMLDMGFEPQIRKIVKHLPNKRQSCLFSATWPKEVQQIARGICWNETVHIQVGTSDALTANSDITQHVIVVNGRNDKWKHLQQILADSQRKNTKGSILVFSNTKRGCADLARGIQQNLRCPASAIHGDMDQSARDNTLQRFKDGKDMVMVATDVAQRGLDVRNITVVVNWDAPNSGEDYVHRIGRTGRGGECGDSYIFLFRDESKIAKEIVKLMTRSGQAVPEGLRQVAESNAYPSSRSGPYGGKKGSGSKGGGKGNGKDGGKDGGRGKGKGKGGAKGW